MGRATSSASEAPGPGVSLVLKARPLPPVSSTTRDALPVAAGPTHSDSFVLLFSLLTLHTHRTSHHILTQPTPAPAPLTTDNPHQLLLKRFNLADSVCLINWLLLVKLISVSLTFVAAF